MIRIISVGRIKEKYLKDGMDEYIKRLSKFTKLEMIELKDIPVPDKASLSEENEIKKEEGKEILSRIKDDYVIALDLKGEMLDSVSFSKKIEEINTSGKSKITFVIGGSLGLSKEVIDRSNYQLSFSPMTFTHQLFKLILLEQIYRAYKILNNETYHK